MSVVTRAPRCPRCGAPLVWRGTAAVVECTYCKTHVAVETGQVTQQPANAITYKPLPAAVWIVGASLMLMVVAGVVIASVSSRVLSSGVQGVAAASKKVSLAELASVQLATTPEALAQRFGVQVIKDSVYVDIDGGKFKRAHFLWDPKHLEHVRMVALSYATGDQAPAEVLDRARAQIGRSLRPAATGGHQYNGEGVNLSLSSSLYINAHNFDDPRWKERLNALWNVVKGAALETQDKLDEATKRDVLNLGYPLTRIAEIRFDIDVDGAEREVHRLIPGAVSQKERHEVGLDHPWFETATLRWENQANGKWTSTNLYFAKEFNFKAQREALERCLTPIMGEPKRNVRDHLAGEVTLDFKETGGIPRVHISHQLAMILVRRAAGDSADGFRKVIHALSQCGS